MHRFIVVIAALAGCGRVDFASLSATDAGNASPDAARAIGPCTAWSAPQVVGGVNDITGFRSTAVAPDGLSISAIAWDTGQDLYYATRPSRDAAFSSPSLVTGLPANLWDVSAIDGGRTLLYAVSATNDCPKLVTSGTPWDFSASTPVDLTVGCLPSMQGGVLLDGGLTLYSTSQSRLQVAHRASLAEPFTSVTLLAEITLGAGYPAVRGDQLELYFENAAAGSYDLYVSSRPTPESPWGTPVPIAEVNSATATDEDVTITADGTELYFDSDRSAQNLVYKSTRTCQ